MKVTVTNAQQALPVAADRIERLARCAMRRLSIRKAGILAISFIDGRQMRHLNKRFLRHDCSTDVLSFRYEREPTIGEILIAPLEAQTYARQHGIPYEEELSRYVVHGLLHWLGHEDKTRSQQRAMRLMEDRLLACCA